MHIRVLAAVNGFDNTEDLEKLVEEHPELEELLLSWSDNLKDLTPLLSLEHLQHVTVSADMEEAIESLGEDYGFELEIEG